MIGRFGAPASLIQLSFKANGKYDFGGKTYLGTAGQAVPSQLDNYLPSQPSPIAEPYLSFNSFPLTRLLGPRGSPVLDPRVLLN